MIIELKNDLAIRGTLHSVDQYLNIKLHDVRVEDEEKYPHMVRLPFLILLLLPGPLMLSFLLNMREKGEREGGRKRKREV